MFFCCQSLQLLMASPSHSMLAGLVHCSIRPQVLNPSPDAQDGECGFVAIRFAVAGSMLQPFAQHVCNHPMASPQVLGPCKALPTLYIVKAGCSQTWAREARLSVMRFGTPSVTLQPQLPKAPLTASSTVPVGTEA